MSCRRGVVALALLSVGVGHVAAQGLTTGERTKVTSLLAPFDRSAGPGCAVAIRRGGETVFERAVGMAQLDHDIPLTSTSVLYVASIAKQFTAAATLMAAHEGLIDLDADMRRYLPEFPDHGATITVRNLLHHTSGIPDFLLQLRDRGIPWENVLTDPMVWQLLREQSALEFAPGTKIQYSNSGYLLLAEIIRRTTGESLGRYADRKLFAPLGMAGTHFHEDRTAIVKGRAFGYDPGPDGVWHTNYNMNFDRVGGGGLYTTLGDLERWDAAFDSDQLGLPDFAGQMYRRGVLTNGDSVDYAAGLGVGTRHGHRRVAHGGGFMAFRTMFVRYPEVHVSVITLCNDGSADATSLSASIEDVLLPED